MSITTVLLNRIIPYKIFHIYMSHPFTWHCPSQSLYILWLSSTVYPCYTVACYGSDNVCVCVNHVLMFYAQTYYSGNYNNHPYKSWCTSGDCPGACDSRLCSKWLKATQSNSHLLLNSITFARIIWFKFHLQLYLFCYFCNTLLFLLMTDNKVNLSHLFCFSQSICFSLLLSVPPFS